MPELVTYLDPTTGGYVIENNTLKTAPPVVNKANRLLKQPLGADIQYPLLGNPLLTRKYFAKANEVITDINTCLSPLVNSGQLLSVVIVSLALTLTKKWVVEIQLNLPNDTSEIIQWSNK